MKNLFKVSIVVILFTGCVLDNNGNFEIVNNSDFNLDSVNIQPDANKQFVNIPQGTTLNLTTNMNNVHSDGSYQLSFKNTATDKRVEHKFGYYTNGYQIEEKITIAIENDTIVATVPNDTMIINKD